MDDEPVFDPATRRLCPDGSCVGVLDREGRCSECGRAGGPLEAEADMALADDAMEGVAPEAPEAPGVAAPASEGFDPSRKLCDDGSCVGVVGADGRCSVCGRRSGG